VTNETHVDHYHHITTCAAYASIAKHVKQVLFQALILKAWLLRGQWLAGKGVRGTEGAERLGNGEGVSLPIRLEGLRERRELPNGVRAASPDRKLIKVLEHHRIHVAETFVVN